MVLIYSMEILFHIFYRSDLEYFLIEIWVFALLLKIQIYSKFYLTLVLDFLNTTTNLLTCLIHN